MNGSLTSDFSKVKFRDIPESYGIAEAVSLQYVISSDHEPSAKDWIGLYRVGWKSIKEYVTYEWIGLPENYALGTQVECVCTFKENLPTNDEDFFQFCYINSQSKVCGASSPFQFLEDYDIVVICETDSMLIVGTGPTSEHPADRQQHSLCSDELVIVQDEVERLTEELLETKQLLMDKDSQLKDIGSEVNQLQTDLKQSKDISRQLTEDVDSLKSELLDEKEKQILTEKSFTESTKHYERTLAEFSERELVYKEKETKLNVTVKDLQRQLCEKCQELELLKVDHSSNLSMLDIKQLTVEDLTKRCSKLSTELNQMKKMRKKTVAVPLQSTSKDETQINPVDLEKQIEFHRNNANSELATDGVENLTGKTAEGGVAQKQSSVNKTETDSSSNDQFDVTDGTMQSRRTCRVCTLTFPVGTSRQVIKDHLQSHQKVCPLCNLRFELNCSQEEFETHVSAHLADTIKSADGCKICPVCHLGFPAAYAQDMFEIHVWEHLTGTRKFADGSKNCPVCFVGFPAAVKQDEFEIHVYQHFGDTVRPL